KAAIRSPCSVGAALGRSTATRCGRCISGTISSGQRRTPRPLRSDGKQSKALARRTRTPPEPIYRSCAGVSGKHYADVVSAAGVERSLNEPLCGLLEIRFRIEHRAHLVVGQGPVHAVRAEQQDLAFLQWRLADLDHQIRFSP